MPAPLKDVVRSNVMLDRMDKEHLEILAEVEDRSISALIREAIALYLKGRKS